MTSLTIILLSASVFAGMFPRVLISSLGSIYDLTIYNAASGDYALKLMTYFSIAILPFVLGSQIWSFYVFRQPVKSDKRFGVLMKEKEDFRRILVAEFYM